MKPLSSNGDVPLVGILRGVTPERVVSIANTLYGAGIRMIEVPLNSPDPFASIAALVACNRSDWIIGAGTVLTVDDARRTQAAGGRLVVAPNCDPEVIGFCVEAGLTVMPGFVTPTEAFQAIKAGARHLKLFPAASLGPKYLQALCAVLPRDARVFPVGGVDAPSIPDWQAAGAAGFGLGSELFRPEYTLTDIEQRAKALVQAARPNQRPLPAS
jgi:2-dehydro-3-deoxyphosphogalactonate aldolase